MKKHLLTYLLLSLLFISQLMGEGAFRESSGSKSLFVSIEESPQKVYMGQVFPIKVKAIVASKDIDTLTTTFINGQNTSVLNAQTPWVNEGSNTFSNTFFVKINSAKSVMPKMNLSAVQSRETIANEIIELPLPSVVQLKADNQFCNVIAQSLNVNKYKTTSFDSKNVIMVLEIESTAANLQDFKLPDIAKSGIDSFSENNGNQKIYYYAILPNYQRSFEFTYFDLPTNKFKKVSLPINIENEEVSTQLGLNPKESIFEFYKTVAYGVFAFLFLVILIKTRRWYYAIPALLFLALFFLDKNPLNHVQLKAKSSLMILPTERSTVFFTSDKQLPVERIGERDTYIKILLPDGKIGWTQRENIIQN